MNYRWALFVVGLMIPTMTIGGTSSLTPDLLQKLRLRDPSLSDADLKKSLLEVGNMSAADARPILEMYYSSSEIRRPSSVAGCAQIALAKIGDDRAWSEIKGELASRNPVVHREAFAKLSMVGNKKAIMLLGEYLFVDEVPTRQETPPGPQGEKPQGVVKFFAPSYLAAQALAQLFGDISPTKNNSDFYDNADIEQWRQWWLANKDKYGN